MFRIFVDEVGHHDLKSADSPNQRFLGLTGVIMRLEYADGRFTDYLNAIKQDIFNDVRLVLHRKELVGRKPPFDALLDPSVEARFNEQLLRLIGDSTYRLFTVVIDKLEHTRRYNVWRFQPYHYCMTVLLERYVQWLLGSKERGDVMFEARAKKDNMKLEAAYKRLYAQGTDHVPPRSFQRALTSREIKLKPKTANIAGLQLADLLANPCCRDLICLNTGTPMTADFGKQIVEIVRKRKYLRRYDGKIEGRGTKWLP